MKWGVRKDSNNSKGSFFDTYAKITHPVTYYTTKAVQKTNTYKTAKKKAAKVNNKRKNLMGSRESKSLTKYRNQNIDKMSNKELQDAVNRMNLEKQYRNLTKVDLMSGQKISSDVMKYYGSYNAYNNVYKSAVKKAAEKATVKKN